MSLFISEKQARVFENEIRGLLACVQKSLNDGMPEVGLPPLNPLKVDEISLELGTLAPELLRYYTIQFNYKLNLSLLVLLRSVRRLLFVHFLNIIIVVVT